MARVLTGRSPAEALAVILALVCIVAGFVAGRPDAVALAAPFALLALTGRTERGGRTAPDGGEAPSVRISPDPRAQGSRLRLLLAPSTAGGAPTDGIVATTLAAPGCPPDALVLRSDEECPLLVRAPPSGEADVLSYGAAGFTAGLAVSTPFAPAPPVRVSILPPIGEPLPRPVSRRLMGLAGTHASRRAGDGGELRSIAPLQPGDALRRIDWRATARRSTDQDRLMVRRSFADAEASVFLVVDQAHDLPSSTADWFSARPHLSAGSLHVARTAAATVAASFIAGGDRVGLDDLSGTRRALRSAGGARHLEQIRVRLAGTSVVPRRRRRRDPVPPQGAVVVVFSAFLDAEPARLLRLWRAQGHLVAGVGCVPPLARSATTTAQTQAVQLTLVRRRLLLEDLRSEGIPIFSGATADARVTAGADEIAGHGGSRAAFPGAPSGAVSGAVSGVASGAAALMHPPSGSLPDLETGLRLLARQARRRGGSPAPGVARGAVQGSVDSAVKGTAGLSEHDPASTALSADGRDPDRGTASARQPSDRRTS